MNLLGLKIGETVNADAVRIYGLHLRSVRKLCKDYYTPYQIDKWLEKRSPEGYLKGIQNGEMYIAEWKNEIVGFGHAIAGEVVAIFEDPKHIGKGIGKVLLSQRPLIYVRLFRSTCNSLHNIDYTLMWVPTRR